ncbi:MAG TPA: hypothetical protein VGK99_21945 [Acidobacteriota bacterium]|jgi:DNA invertase Pin-like site-specific DNA recombinase
MSPKKRKPQLDDPTAELLRNLLIVELAKAGVSQSEIRKIAGCNMHRVSRIARHLKKAKREAVE